MKKKIIIGVFSLLILITAIIFIVGAISSYNDDIKNHPDDKMLGFGSVVILALGSFAVFYELDLFYTVYCFFIKPKTTVKWILNILSNLTLLTIIFTDSIAHFLYKYVSEIFGEEMILLFALLCMYIILRMVCAIIPYKQSVKEI